jgi:hypothetical protein
MQYKISYIAKTLALTSLTPYVFYLYRDISKLAEDITHARRKVFAELLNEDFILSLKCDEKILVNFKSISLVN